MFGWSRTMIESLLYDIFPVVSETFGFSVKKMSQNKVSPLKLISHIITVLKNASDDKVEYILGMTHEEELVVGKRTFLTEFDNGMCFPMEYAYSLMHDDPLIFDCYIAIGAMLRKMGASCWADHTDFIIEPYRDMIESHDHDVQLGNKPDDDDDYINSLRDLVICYESGSAADCMSRIHSMENPSMVLDNAVKKLDPKNEVHQEMVPIAELIMELFATGIEYGRFEDPFADEEDGSGATAGDIYGMIWSDHDQFLEDQDNYFSERIGNYGFSNMCLWEVLPAKGSNVGSWFVERLEKVFAMLCTHANKVEDYAKNLRRLNQDAGTGGNTGGIPG